MKQKLRNLSFLLIKIIVIIIILTIINKYIFMFHIVKETNMKPSINPSDLLIFYRFNDKINNNDIVYIDKIYRVVGNYEDDIKIINKHLYINDEEYFYITEEDNSLDLKKYELLLIDNNNYYVMSKNSIKGKLIFRLQIRGF